MIRFVKNIRRFFMSIFIGIKNIIEYAPLIYRDRDWDYCYLLKMLEFKLGRMENHFSNCYFFDDGEQPNIISEVNEVKNLISRSLNDNYLSDEIKEHYKKWGEFSLYGAIEEKGNTKIVPCRYKNASTDEEQAKARFEFSNLMNRKDKMNNDDLEKAFNIISKRVVFWWD